MKTPLKIRTYQFMSPRKRGEGLRIGTTNRQPDRVSKKDFVRMDYFDVWFPTLGPSNKLREWTKSHDILGSREDWEKFVAKYEREMEKNREPRQALILLAEMAKRTPISIGCYCEDESRCHRSILLKLIKKAATPKFQQARK